jgi:hypothetical protein
MAAPMVTGALAILKQADPSLTAAELKSLIVSMSTKTANYRLEGKLYPAMTFDFDKPVLDFSEIARYILRRPSRITVLTFGVSIWKSFPAPVFPRCVRKT